MTVFGLTSNKNKAYLININIDCHIYMEVKEYSTIKKPILIRGDVHRFKYVDTSGMNDNNRR